MKKTFIFIAASLVFLSLQAQITQSEADSIVLERMSQETRQHTIHAQENVQTNYSITTSQGEVLELDYPCWIYYINYFKNTIGHYLVVKESNGNLLKVKTKNNVEPSDLAQWRIIKEEPIVLIAQGVLCGRESIIKQNIVITTKTDWENLKTAMNTVNNVTDSFADIDIDFSKYQIIAVFDKLKVNGGWTIDITDITEYANSLEVTVRNLKTGDSTITITRPYYIVQIPVNKKNVVFQMETSDEEPKLGCDCKDELFYYYRDNKQFLDTFLLNDYLLIACDIQIQNTEIVNYINQIDLFNPVDTNKIFRTSRGEYHLLFVTTKINRSCSQLKEIISFLENNSLIDYANLTFDTDAWFGDVYMDIMFYHDEFFVQIQNVNDLYDLNFVVQETNTRIKQQTQFDHSVYIISADKKSKGNALQMSNYFYETGKFVFCEPNFVYARINR
jgi:hypothetical protein